MDETRQEYEIKIPVADLEAVRHALVLEGAQRLVPRTRERNLLFDSEDGRLRSSGAVLRLRLAGERALLTLKGPASFSGPVKQRTEYEVEVSDGACLLELLQRLGFSVCGRYEKERESWRLGTAVVALDHTPMGDFVEIEGEPENLTAAAHRLGLESGKAVRASYPRLWDEHRRAHPAKNLPEHMVFAP